MQILLLGPDRGNLTTRLEAFGDSVRRTEGPLQPDSALLDWADMLVSYGYKHIVRPEVLERFPDRAVNLHISLLPWNRGYHPNVWSFLEDTPKGVTIHFMDEGLDTGDIIVQREIHFDSSDTLSSSYTKLSREIEELLIASWIDIRDGRAVGRKQPPGGTLHRRADLEDYQALLVEGWDTPVSEIIGAAKGD